MTQLTLQNDVVRRHGTARSDNQCKILMQTVKMSEDVYYSKKNHWYYCVLLSCIFGIVETNKEIKQPGIKQINSIYLVGELVTSYDV